MKVNMSSWWIGFSSFVWGLYAALITETLVGNHIWNALDGFLFVAFFFVCVGVLTVSIVDEEDEA